jgi:hypothetical protein
MNHRKAVRSILLTPSGSWRAEWHESDVFIGWMLTSWRPQAFSSQDWDSKSFLINTWDQFPIEIQRSGSREDLS